MYKLIPIFLFAFCFTEKVEVYYKTDTPIAGFQFTVTGATVYGASGGAAEEAEFTMAAGGGNNTVVGFSLTGEYIPAGEGILTVLEIAGDPSATCIDNVIISNSDGYSLDYELDCLSITTGSDPDSYCGDGECNGDEDFGSCPEDCEEPGACMSDVCLSFSNFNESAGSIDVWMENTVDIAGYQIVFDGITLTGASGGLSEAAGFMISNSETMVLGFSVSGDVISPSSGNLVTLTFSDYSGFACFVEESTTFSDANAGALDLDLGDCQGAGPVEGCTDMDANSIHVTSGGTVLYNTDTPIAGFQFDLDGANVLSASGGNSEAAGFMISANETTVLGFSLDGSTIDGCGTMIELELDGDASGLSGIIISEGVGVEIPFSYFEGGGGDDGPCCGDDTCDDNETEENCPEDCDDGIDSNIRGKITNSDGEPIIGTQVFIEELGIGSVADTAGNYILLNLPIGSYEITAEMILYRSQIISNVIVDAEKTTELNITLYLEEHLKPSDGSINKFYNTSWAVIIGINEYENISPLRFAVQDAKEIRKLLISEFSFPKENVRILIDNEATLNNIRDALYEIATLANEEDRILVYFAGHGETRSLKSGVEKGYLIPTDGNLDKIFNTCLPMTAIKDIANETVAKHILFLMDACFSGLAAVDTRGIDRSTPGYIEKIVRDQARQIITAGGKKDEVIEKDEWGHSAFAKNLIQGLKSAVADQDYDGYITADELGTFLQKRVYIDSENMQRPLKARFGNGEGEFVFLARKIIESAIIGIVPNEWGEDRTSSIKADLLTVEDIHLIYGENEIVKKLYQKIVELSELLAQGVQFIYGCMDENALNYNSDANLDDESCIVLDSDNVFIRFGDFHNLDSTLDVFMASNRRIYNLEFFTEGFEIVDILDGNLGLDNIKTSFDLEEIYVEFSDSLDGYIIPKEETLVFKAKIIPIDEAFCFRGLIINDHDTTNVKLGECKAGLMVQEVVLTDTTEVEILTGEYAAETGTILRANLPYNYCYIKNVDLNKSIIEIGMNFGEEVAGFQFEIDGVSIMNAYGGAATENGFMLSSNSTTAIGFSLTGATISAGRYTLVELEVSSINDAYSICIHGIIVSDASGNAIDIETGECWVP